jgi:DNA polymerase
MSNFAAAELASIYGVTEIINFAQPISARREEDSWELIEADLADCKRCGLCSTRQNIVFGSGSRNAKLMFIGEGPGADEDKTGLPFVGRAGQLLTKMIEAMRYTREDVFIANVVKCRPPENRDPFQIEVDACIGFLRRQIRLVKPEVIVALGAVSAVHLLGLDPQTAKISKIRGTFQNYENAKVMPTFHPSYLLRNETKKKDVWEDLKKVMLFLGQTP